MSSPSVHAIPSGNVCQARGVNTLASTAFRNDKQIGVNPRNTSYDYIDRPGESLLDDANEDIVNRWFAEEGVGMPHHRQSEFHRIHQKNARIGLPWQGAREDGRSGTALEVQSV